MSIVSISRIQHRKGLQQDIPQLASAELGWSLDTQKLYIGNGTILEGAPQLGNTEILTEHSDILRLAETYTFRNSDAGYTPTTGGRTSRYNAIAFGNDVYVAIGTEGATLISPDAESWTPTYTGTTVTLNDICFGNGKFLAVGASGVVLTSADGIVWTQSLNAIYVTLSSVVYATGAINKFFAVSTLGTIVTSVTGVDWEIVDTPPYDGFFAIDYEDNLLVIAGSAGTILTSEDGEIWDEQTTPTNNDLKSVKYVNDRWIAAGVHSTILYSMDAVTWEYGYSDAFTSAATDGDTWVLVGYGGVIYNTTASPTIRTSNTSNNLNDIIYVTGSDRFVAVGENGTILTSTDGGLTWTIRTSNTSNNLNSIAHNDTTGKYVVVGNAGTVLTSVNSTVWTLTGSTLSGGGRINEDLNDVSTWSDVAYIAVGNNGVVYSTPNLTSWTVRSSGIPNDLYSITVGFLGGSTYLAVATGKDGVVITSTNTGITWLLSDSGTSEHLRGVKFITWSHNGSTISRFIAVGNNGTIIASDVNTSPITSWSPINYPTISHFFNIFYDNDSFYIVGSIGYTSLSGSDILDFRSLSNESLGALYTSTIGYSGPTFYTVNYGADYYIIAGQYDSILTSTDGIKFYSQTQRNFSLTYLNTTDVHDFIFNDNMFIGVGSRGLILTSSDGEVWDGVSYIYGTSDNTRTMQKKLDDFVNVKDFGARGDGSTDDTESINRALYEIYCRTISPSSRKKLYFPAGTYMVRDGIRVPSYATLQGEGCNNSIIIQTADPNYVTYVLTTADSKQQVEGQVGYNSAVLPTDISISDIGFRATGDGIWISHCKNASFSRLKISGAQNYPLTAGEETVGFYIIGASLTAPSDISITDTVVEKFNYGIEQRSNESSRNVVINSTTFNNLYKGIKLGEDEDGGLGSVNNMTISNCLFDSIAANGIVAWNCKNVISTFNSYRDVGNNYMGSPDEVNNFPVINFSEGNTGCLTIGDEFTRTSEENETYPWVLGNENTDAWHTGKELRIGLYSQTAGKKITLIPDQTNANTGIQFQADNNTFNKRIHYMIKRSGVVRTGILQCSYVNSSVNIDDDSSQTGSVGVVFSLYIDGSTVYLRYTSTAPPGNFYMSYSEKTIKMAW